MKSLGIVGSGLSALSCSSQLINQLANIEIRIFEKAKGIAGRAATRRITDYTFDHGANYMSLDSLSESQVKNVKQLLEKVDQKNERTLINYPIYILNQDESITVSERQSDKITFPKGINYLGKLIDQHNQSQWDKYSIERETFITHLEQIKNEQGQVKWRMLSNDKQVFISDSILMCPPGPQTHKIIEQSIFLPEFQSNKQEILDVLSKSQYHQIISIALGFNQIIETPYYALLNLDKKHEVSWLSLENKKDGHVQPNKTMVIIQMSSDWSVANWSKSTEELVQSVKGKVESILNLKEPQYDISDVQKWKYALPKAKANKEDLLKFGQIGLYFSGDSFSDRGRIGVALASGLETSENILKYSKL